MRNDKIVLAVHVLDNADILKEYLEWYASLGVDFVVANDWGSTDGSRDILDDFAKKKFLQWRPQNNKRMTDWNPSDELASIARDQHGAGWIMLFDTDEFLTVDRSDLKGVLAAVARDVTALRVNCLNMTGSIPNPGENALRTLTLRIERTVQETHEQALSGDLPVPYIFIGHPPKTIVRASTFVGYGVGGHSATTNVGDGGEHSDLRILHFAIRGFAALQSKVRNTEAWFAQNPQLTGTWGWHWRRWIRLSREGRLREDYEAQFVSPARAEELLHNGTCVRDEAIARFLKPRTWAARLRKAGDQLIRSSARQ
jgi:hypothetical protein